MTPLDIRPMPAGQPESPVMVDGESCGEACGFVDDAVIARLLSGESVASMEHEGRAWADPPWGLVLAR